MASKLITWLHHHVNVAGVAKIIHEESNKVLLLQGKPVTTWEALEDDAVDVLHNAADRVLHEVLASAEKEILRRGMHIVPTKDPDDQGKAAKPDKVVTVSSGTGGTPPPPGSRTDGGASPEAHGATVKVTSPLDQKAKADGDKP